MMETKKVTRKSISIVLILCLIVSVFSFGVAVNAAADDNMFEFKSTAGYPYVEYLSTSEFVKGDSYTFTCRFLATNSQYTYTAAQLKDVFIIWGADSSGGGTRPVWSGMPGFSIAYDTETKTVTAHFTAGNDSVNNRTMTPGSNDYIQFRFGDRNAQFRGWGNFFFSDFSLVRDSTGAEMFTAPIDSSYVTSGAAASNKDKWSTAGAGSYCAVKPKGATFGDPVINTNLFYINGNQTNLQVQFRTTGDFFKFVAGEQYIFTCKAKCNVPQYIQRGKLLHFNYYNNDSAIASISQTTDENYSESYDSSTYVYTASFTVPEDCRNYTNAYFTFGDRNDQLSGYQAYFTDFAIRRVSDGAITYFPLIKSGNVYNSALAANDMYRIPSDQTAKVLVQQIGTAFDLASFNGGDMNEDGTTDILDLVRFKKMIAGTVPVTMVLDCNEDGEENAADLAFMTQILFKAGVPGLLQNTYCKLRYQKSLNIGYIGGSVTNGTGASSDDTCYRALVTDYFEENFPLATITENNMGVGGTGSYLGAARFSDNILKQNPDLVFIEFAINDRYNGISAEQTKQDIEYMIKALHTKNAYADIVILLITDKTAFGTEYPALLAIKSVAEYYKLPIVDVGAAMYEELGGSTANWNDYYFDSVHPLDAGHRVYADAIADKLDELLVNGGKSPHSLPVTPVCANGFTSVQLLTRDSFEPFQWGQLDDSAYGANYWFASNDYEVTGCPFRSSNARCFSSILPKYLYPKYDGATLEFTVTGNTIGILGTLKEGQSLTVTLDNSVTKTVNGSARSEMTEYPLWDSLTNTTHTVRIVAHGDGPYITIAAVFVGR